MSDASFDALLSLAASYTEFIPDMNFSSLSLDRILKLKCDLLVLSLILIIYNLSNLYCKTIMLKALVQPVTPFQQNASIIYCDETMKCAIVDPGGDIEILLHISKENNLIPEKILLTHGHIDHAGGATEISEILNIEIHGPHVDDKFLLDSLQKQGEMFGMPSKNCTPDKWLNDGDIIYVGNEKLEVYLCPGHTPGHIIFFHELSKLAIVGDVLFAGSIGRTDLPGGNYNQLIESIKTKLWPLGEDIAFVPGHGPPSNFKIERSTNPFVADSNL